MYALYTDDSILAGPRPKEIDHSIYLLCEKKLDTTEEGTLEDFLGVNIDRRSDGRIHLTQPHLIASILKYLNLLRPGMNTRRTPMSSSHILRRHATSHFFDKFFDYRSVVWRMNYLERGSRSGISYAVHRCARFDSSPKQQHGEAVKWLGRYLLATKDKWKIVRPQANTDLEVYVDADFAGNYDSNDKISRDTARSRHGYIIMYKGCPINWKSQLQHPLNPNIQDYPTHYVKSSHKCNFCKKWNYLVSQSQAHHPWWSAKF